MKLKQMIVIGSVILCLVQSPLYNQDAESGEREEIVDEREQISTSSIKQAPIESQATSSITTPYHTFYTTKTAEEAVPQLSTSMPSQGEESLKVKQIADQMPDQAITAIQLGEDIADIPQNTFSAIVDNQEAFETVSFSLAEHLNDLTPDQAESFFTAFKRALFDQGYARFLLEKISHPLLEVIKAAQGGLDSKAQVAAKKIATFLNIFQEKTATLSGEALYALSNIVRSFGNQLQLAASPLLNLLSTSVGDLDASLERNIEIQRLGEQFNVPFQQGITLKSIDDALKTAPKVYASRERSIRNRMQSRRNVLIDFQRRVGELELKGTVKAPTPVNYKKDAYYQELEGQELSLNTNYENFTRKLGYKRVELERSNTVPFKI